MGRSHELAGGGVDAGGLVAGGQQVSGQGIAAVLVLATARREVIGQPVAVDVVSFTTDQEALRSAIRIACRERLARHKIPTRVTFVPSVSGERMKKTR